jgi:hypothetical protein
MDFHRFIVKFPIQRLHIPLVSNYEKLTLSRLKLHWTGTVRSLMQFDPLDNDNNQLADNDTQTGATRNLPVRLIMFPFSILGERQAPSFTVKRSEFTEAIFTFLCAPYYLTLTTRQRQPNSILLASRLTVMDSDGSRTVIIIFVDGSQDDHTHDL